MFNHGLIYVFSYRKHLPIVKEWLNTCSFVNIHICAKIHYIQLMEIRAYTTTKIAKANTYCGLTVSVFNLHNIILIYLHNSL